MAVGDTITYASRQYADPETGRTIIQLTHGAGYTYPLYYYGPSVTRDGDAIIFHRFHDQEVQLWRLDIDGGIATQLTEASTPRCLWRFWDEPVQARGVREQLSAFNPNTEQVLYFDENAMRTVHVRTLEQRCVYELPADRIPCALPGFSPDGRWFTFAHLDRAWWEDATTRGAPPTHEAQDCRLDVLDVQNGTVHNALVVNNWITHVNFYDNDRLVFANLPTEGAVLLTHRRGGYYVHLRPQTSAGWMSNHYVMTERGIMYETRSPGDFGVIGMCDPDTYLYHDFRANLPIHHIGWDPEGECWFGDCYRPERPRERLLAWLPEVRHDRLNEFEPLTSGMALHGQGQRSHVHPVLTPDRRHILFTGPDDENQTNHIFLLDVSDHLLHTHVETDPSADTVAQR